MTADYDAGPIIAQEAVPVRPDDDAAALAARVFEAELEILPRVVRDLVEGRVALENGRVVHRAP